MERKKRKGCRLCMFLIKYILTTNIVVFYVIQCCIIFYVFILVKQINVSPYSKYFLLILLQIGKFIMKTLRSNIILFIYNCIMNMEFIILKAKYGKYRKY